MATETTAEWLEGVQRTMGIEYAPDDAEERLQSLTAAIEAGLKTARVEVIGVEYYGHVDRPTGPDKTRRTTLRRLVGCIVDSDGTKYGLSLHGPIPPHSGGRV